MKNNKSKAEFLIEKFERSSVKKDQSKTINQKVEELLLSEIHELQRELKPSIWKK